MARILLLFFFPLLCFSQPKAISYNQLQKGVYSITFFSLSDAMEKKDSVYSKSATASAFIDHGKIYLACAKHSIKQFAANGQSVLFSISYSKDSVVYQYGLVYYDTSKADIAIIRPIPLPNFPVAKYVTNGAVLFKENSLLSIFSSIYCLGYPTYSEDSITHIYRSISEKGEYSPLIKRASISGYDLNNSRNRFYYVDVNLSKGFSGGPVYYFDTNINKLYLIGIVTASLLANNLDVNMHMLDNSYNNGAFSIVTDIKHIYPLLKLSGQ